MEVRLVVRDAVDARCGLDALRGDEHCARRVFPRGRKRDGVAEVADAIRLASVGEVVGAGEGETVIVEKLANPL